MTKLASAGLAFSMLIAVQTGFAACDICGCNDEPVVENGTDISCSLHPGTTVHIPQCCDTPWPTDLTGDHVIDGADYAAACGVSVDNIDDYDKCTQNEWYTTPTLICSCHKIASVFYPHDAETTHTWSGTVDRCTQGTYRLTVTIRNTVVHTTALGGVWCTECCSPDSENCCGESYCTEQVPITKIETKAFYVDVIVDPPTRCGSCTPNSCTWECDVTDPVTCYGDSSDIGFHNVHFFDYKLAGVPQGSGHVGGESVYSYYDQQILLGTRVVHEQSGYEKTNDETTPSTPEHPYRGPAALYCNWCGGAWRFGWGDQYGRSTYDVDENDIWDDFFDNYDPDDGPDTWTYTLTYTTTINQDALVDYGTDHEQAFPFERTITLTRSYEIIVDPAFGIPLGAWLDDCSQTFN